MVELYDFLKRNPQIKFYHMPSNVLQGVLGGGYVPDTEEGKRILQKLEELSKKDPFSRAYQKELAAYKRAWEDASKRQFDFNGQSRWVPGTWSHDAGYYIYDETTLRILMMSQAERDKLDYEPSRIEPDNFGDATNPLAHTFRVLTASLPNVFELKSLPKRWGIDMFNRHIALVESEKPRRPIPGAFDPIDFNQPKYRVVAVPQALPPKQEPEHRVPKVVVFKFSIDDWLGLLNLLHHGPSLAALREGGIITEGFQTRKQAQVLKRFLEEAGFHDIPVAAGYQFTDAELDAAKAIGKTNLEFERSFYQADHSGRILGFEAFPYSDLESADIITPRHLLERASANARQSGSKGIDAIVYGMGLELADHLDRELAAGRRGIFGRIDAMGGGRELNGKWERSRNAIVQKEKSDHFFGSAARDGARVTTYSSNEFGGDVTAIIPRGEGNANPLLDVLNELTLKNMPWYAKVLSHWKHWTQGFLHHQWDKMDKLHPGQPRPADPREIVLTKLGTSPLGMRIAYEILVSETYGGMSPYGTQWVDLTRLKEGMPFAQALVPAGTPGAVAWPTRKLPADEEAKTAIFRKDSEQLLQILSHHLTPEQVRQAIEYADAVRRFGPFSDEAVRAQSEHHVAAERCDPGVFARKLGR